MLREKTKDTIRIYELLRRLIFHPIFLSLIISFVGYYLLSFNFNKSIFHPLETISFKHGGQDLYYDFDNDEELERISLAYNNEVDKYPQVTIYSNGQALYDQWHLSGQWLAYHKPIIGDFDGDGFKEMYTVTKSNDSLFLHGIEFLGDQGHFINHRFVSKANWNYRNQIDVYLVGGNLQDADYDGKSDLYFILYAGFSMFPRNVFLYNIETDSLHISPHSGAGIYAQPIFEDINKDSLENIMGTIYAHGNYSETVPYKDSSAYIIVFDHDLSFRFTPIEMKGYPGSVTTIPYIKNDTTSLLCLHRTNNAQTGADYCLYIYSINGELITKRHLLIDENHNYYDIFFVKTDLGNGYYLFNNLGELYFIDDALNVLKIGDELYYKGMITNSISYVDVDFDGINEVLVYNNQLEKILILSQQLELYTSLDVGSVDVRKLRFYDSSINNNRKILHIVTGKKRHSFEIVLNPLHPWQYPIYLSIFALVFLFFHFLNRVQKRLAQEKYEHEKDMIRLQYNSIKSQIDPHFTLNVLNSISGLYSTKRHDEVERNMIRFSRLMQQSLMNSDRIAVSLDEELAFCSNFIEIQRTRFD